MTKNSTDLKTNTLRYRIWLAVGALAVLNCVFGLLIYFVASFFTSSTFFIVFATFLTTSFCTAVFGQWMSNEILRPIEKVILLAKSLNRSSIISLPKTTGSSETDELLQTLHRNSQQLHNLIGMMDDVSSGNTEIALTPLQNADRLSTSFQKLVSKVTDSVDAAQELEDLQTAVNQLNSDLSTIKNGNLNVEIRCEFAATKAICDAVRMLILRQNELVEQVQVNSEDANRLSMEATKLVRTAIESDDARVRRIRRAAGAFKHGPTNFEQLALNVSSALSGVDKSIKDFEVGKQWARESAGAIHDLRRQANAASQRLQRINDQSQAITQVSKLAEDLARRSNLIALNTAIQAASPNAASASLIADEIASLSNRASLVSKEVSAIVESIILEVEDAQSSLKALAAEITAISDQATKSDEAMNQLAPFFEGLVDLPAKIDAGKSDISSNTQRILSVLDEYSSDATEVAANLRQCEQAISKFNTPLENLRVSITHRRLSPTVTMEQTAGNSSLAGSDFGTPPEKTQSSEPLEWQGED